jgi:fructose/tagatose bisphosphate aldolase
MLRRSSPVPRQPACRSSCRSPRTPSGTEAIAAWCHEREVSVEAELGEVGGKDGAHAPDTRTDPIEAKAYVEATGVDALAVAVGSSHAMLTRDAVLDDELIGRLAEAAGVPLVLHGSSGVPDDGLVRAVAQGMAKINVATQLNKVTAPHARRWRETSRWSIPASTSAPAAMRSRPRPNVS